MYDSDQALIRLLQCGVKGFFKKGYSPGRAEICYPRGSAIRFLLFTAGIGKNG